mgnify:CR=1 FL=1
MVIEIRKRKRKIKEELNPTTPVQMAIQYGRELEKLDMVLNILDYYK